MRTMTRNKAKGFAVLLSAAMILGTTVMPAVDAKAKKPKLSKTKISKESRQSKNQRNNESEKENIQKEADCYRYKETDYGYKNDKYKYKHQCKYRQGNTDTVRYSDGYADTAINRHTK